MCSASVPHCPKQRQATAVHFIQTEHLLESNPGNYELASAGVAYRPTGSVTVLGILLFGLRPSVVCFDAEQHPEGFLDECILKAQGLQLLAGSAHKTSEADRATMAGLQEEAAREPGAQMESSPPRQPSPVKRRTAHPFRIESLARTQERFGSTGQAKPAARRNLRMAAGATPCPA